MGIGEGLTGKSYAFPTLNWHLAKRTPEALAASRDKLYEFCLANPVLRFLLTQVGCGLAGYPESQMRALFACPPENLILPEEWL